MSKQFTKLAVRYAGALQKAVTTAGAEPRAVARELAEFAELWKSQPELSSSLVNPMFAKPERRKSLEQILAQSGASDVLRRFVLVVFERERIKAITEISEVFTRRIERSAGVLRVHVTVARQPLDAEQAEIEGALSAQLDGEIEYSWSIEPSLLGGIVVEYDGHVLDGSVSGRLNRLEKQLLG